MCQVRLNNDEGKGREGKGREGKGREGKGREGKGGEGRGGNGRERKGKEWEERGLFTHPIVSPGWSGSVGWRIVCELQGCKLDCRSLCMPRLWVCFLVRAQQGATN